MADPKAGDSVPGIETLDPDFERWKAGRGGGEALPGGDIFMNAPNGGLVVRNGGMFGSTKDPLLKIRDVMWRFYRWDDEKVRKLAEKLGRAGFEVDASSTRDAVWEALYDLLMEAAMRTQALGEDKAPTVDQILQSYLRNPVGSAATKEKPESYTQTSTQLTDPSSARALLDKVLAEELGRDPTAAERNAFLSALHAAERANPVRTTQRLDRSTGMYLTSETSGGIDPEEFARQWVDDDETRAKERGDYQMAGTYFDALLQAIQSPVG